MTQKHTPGPWYSSPNGNISKYHHSELYEYGGGIAGDFPLATVHDGPSHWENKYPKKANAALIAAAPDLYDVAVAAHKHLCDENPRADDLLPLLNALTAAIAKAEGR